MTSDLINMRKYATFNRFSHASNALLKYLEHCIELGQEDDPEGRLYEVIMEANQRGLLTDEEVEIVQTIVGMLVDLRFYDETYELDEQGLLKEIEAKHIFLKDFVIGR